MFPLSYILISSRRETARGSFPYFPPFPLAKYFTSSCVYLHSNLPRILFRSYPFIDIDCGSTHWVPPTEGANLQSPSIARFDEMNFSHSRKDENQILTADEKQWGNRMKIFVTFQKLVRQFDSSFTFFPWSEVVDMKSTTVASDETTCLLSFVTHFAYKKLLTLHTVKNNL